MNQKELFAEHLRSAMEQKQMKQVDLVHAADQAGLERAISASMSVERLFLVRISLIFLQIHWKLRRNGFLVMLLRKISLNLRSIVLL